ncbi:pirin family protein [Gordonia amicalis]|uniref:Pirin family protein n=1 Tax=Gordonia amicalis TaxID=89053 RepID=A0AAE4R0C7_9ACTN|nr:MULTISPECIES: pirin family protein [Gordonia]MCZ4578218.1 pirin family protein [Gordonia amicalis]MDV6311018.1 pirin family protein [Gordonia amicalis]UPW13789.1 pirin family protein [Gordonia amicalis]
MSFTIIRADERHHWRNEWLESWQSFPATGNFDLAANAHGVLLVHNDDRVDAGEGLDRHQHRDAEIVTWVLDGALRHRDSAGNDGILKPGIVQRMTAGRGISHSEGNATGRLDGTDLRVVQMWVAPEETGLEPGYAEADVTTALASGDLVVVVSGLSRHATTTPVTINNSAAALHVAQMPAGRTVTLPASPYGHLYVARGEVDLAGDDTLVEGDAVRTRNAGEISLHSPGGAEILFWEMHAGVA